MTTQTPFATRSPIHDVTAFGGISRTAPEAGPNNGHDFVSIQASAELVELKNRIRRFVLPVSAAFFLWYLGYVLLAAYAPDLMSRKVLGAVHLGLVLGLLQFASTIAITAGYQRYARRRIDPQVALVRKGAAR